MPLALPYWGAAFLADSLPGTLATLRPDGTPHVVAVRFTWDPEAGQARVMTRGSTRKVHNLLNNPRAALFQMTGPRWITLEGSATVSDDPRRVARGVRDYARRYGVLPPSPPGRVVIEIEVDRVMACPASDRSGTVTGRSRCSSSLESPGAQAK
ncbi:pyridoxamine 5'-phosphate oxidase family protein [Streptomyces sp. NPDC019443]|uniref:pyridoxamine 5'-phosphate oxidase family protein n=1 Tax=Streptomyces sp. NPDC019443 TaxID=3365061 RepID=UPI0037917336